MPRGFRVVDTDADLIQPLRFDRSRLLLAAVLLLRQSHA